MIQGDPESIRDFKRSGDFLKWIHNNGSINLSLVILHSIVDSVINSFFSSLRPFDQKRSLYNNLLILVK